MSAISKFATPGAELASTASCESSDTCQGWEQHWLHLHGIFMNIVAVLMNIIKDCEFGSDMLLT